MVHPKMCSYETLRDELTPRPCLHLIQSDNLLGELAQQGRTTLVHIMVTYRSEIVLDVTPGIPQPQVYTEELGLSGLRNRIGQRLGLDGERQCEALRNRPAMQIKVTLEVP